MTEEIIIDGVNVSECNYFNKVVNEEPYCNIDQEHLYTCSSDENCYFKQLKRLEQENKALYEEKNCLHKIIDRLLENAGYSKDIASAEDFEDVYEDMQRKINELAELEQENKELKAYKDINEDFKKAWDELNEKYKQLRSALEEINLILDELKQQYDYMTDYSEIKEIQDKINEVLE